MGITERKVCDNMSDAISRQKAINALYEWECDKKDDRDAIDVINGLPPIQPKRGKWILDRSGAYCCSECMEPCAEYVMMKPRDKFCKMCGSRNEVTE